MQLLTFILPPKHLKKGPDLTQPVTKLKFETLRKPSGTSGTSRLDRILNRGVGHDDSKEKMADGYVIGPSPEYKLMMPYVKPDVTAIDSKGFSLHDSRYRGPWVRDLPDYGRGMIVDEKEYPLMSLQMLQALREIRKETEEQRAARKGIVDPDDEGLNT